MEYYKYTGLKYILPIMHLIITDNNYKLAANKKYYQCAKGVFDQIYTLLDGGKISEPMRHISNSILAIYVSFMICYFIVMNKAKVKKQVIALNLQVTGQMQVIKL